MKNIILILSLIFLVSFKVSSQDEQINVEAINNYKYIIVPLEFDLSSHEDQYQINSLTEFLFNKYGYKAFLENESFPEDLKLNRCLALKADVIEVKGGFLNTKLQINLMDCEDRLVVSSKVGKSREKEHRVAHNLAVRDAFKTFQFFNYKYKSDAVIPALSSNKSVSTKTNDDVTQKEIERLKQEVATLKKEKGVKQNVIKPVVEKPSKVNKIENSKALKGDAIIFYAQPIKKGFQVVDQTPKVIMILLETPKANTFIVKDQNAIVYKEDGFWYISKNDGESISLEALNLKF